MRRQFNDSVDVYNGPGAAFPGVYRGRFPCRVVNFQYRSFVSTPFNEVDGYVTHNTATIAAGIYNPVAGIFGVVLYTGSTLLIQSTGQTYTVVYQELIVKSGTPTYRRAYIRPF